MYVVAVIADMVVVEAVMADAVVVEARGSSDTNNDSNYGVGVGYDSRSCCNVRHN